MPAGNMDEKGITTLHTTHYTKGMTFDIDEGHKSLQSRVKFHQIAAWEQIDNLQILALN